MSSANEGHGRWIVYAAMLIGAVLALTGAGVGFLHDDYFHVLALEDAASWREALDVYALTPGDADALAAEIALGPLPWWTAPDYRMHFFRPLTAFTFAVDHAVFGRWAAGWHVHSALWYALLIVAFAALYRPALTAGTLALAALIFAMDAGHVMPAVWISNRNALVAAVPALLGVAAHVRWRERWWTAGFPLSLLGYSLGALAGEVWLSVVAYTAAYELCARRDGIGKRALCVAPAALLAIAYVTAYAMAGYGVRGADGYTNPFSDPWSYLAEAPARMMTLIAAQLVSAPADVWITNTPMRPILAGVGFITILLFGLLLKRLWPHIEEPERRALRWLIPGALFALIPMLSTFPMNRLLVGPSIGAAAVIAIILGAWWRARQRDRSLWLAWACMALGLLHLAAAPVQWPLQAAQLTHFSREAAAQALTLPETGAPWDDTRVIIAAAENPASLMYIPLIRRLHGLAVPKTWHTLSGGQAPLRITRTAPDRIEVESLDGDLIGTGLSAVLRSQTRPMAAGDRIALDGATVEVRQTTHGRPTAITITFETALDDERYLFLIERTGELIPVRLPDLNSSIEISLE